LITVEEVAQLIRKTMRGKLPADAVLDATTSLKDLGLSSLQISEIVFTLEEEHEVEFDDASAANATTLGDVVALANLALSSRPVAQGVDPPR
jgi:acyl carrier protein